MGDGEAGLEEAITVSQDGIDPDYPLRQQLLGEGRCNAQHIESQTKAKIAVERRNGQLAVVIRCSSEDGLSEAVGMCTDLVDAVLEEAREAQPSSKRRR